MMPDSTPPPLPWEGGCRCGAVRLRVTAAPLLSSACHCRGCQRMSASAYSLTLSVPPGSLEITAGEPIVGRDAGEGVLHMVCADCHTWLFTRPEGAPFVNLRPTMLDDSSWFSPFAETWTSEGLPWAKTPAVRSFERVPPMPEWGALLAEHVDWAAARGWPVP